MFPKEEEMPRMVQPWFLIANESMQPKEVVSRRKPEIIETINVVPNYQVRSTEDEAFLDIEMPGVSKENISVEVHDRRLTIHGTRFHHETSVVKTEDVDVEKEDQDAKKTEPKPFLVYFLDMRIRNDTDPEKLHCYSCKDGLLVLRTVSASKQPPRKIAIC